MPSRRCGAIWLTACSKTVIDGAEEFVDRRADHDDQRLRPLDRSSRLRRSSGVLSRGAAAGARLRRSRGRASRLRRCGRASPGSCRRCRRVARRAAKTRLSGRPTWPPPPRTTRSRLVPCRSCGQLTVDVGSSWRARFLRVFDGSLPPSHATNGTSINGMPTPESSGQALGVEDDLWVLDVSAGTGNDSEAIAPSVIGQPRVRMPASANRASDGFGRTRAGPTHPQRGRERDHDPQAGIREHDESFVAGKTTPKAIIGRVQAAGPPPPDEGRQRSGGGSARTARTAARATGRRTRP